MKSLTVKNMKEALVNYSGTVEDFDAVYDHFYNMAFMGFIDRRTWDRFLQETNGWYVTNDGSEVRDATRNDEVIYSYDSGYSYVSQ